MLGYRIKRLREDKGLQQKDLAKKLDVSPSAIGMYERDEREPNNDLLIKLADFFNVSVDYLLGNSDLKNTESTIKYIPIIGKISAGEPILATENIEGYLPIDIEIYGFKASDDLFFLRVSGQSMNLKVKNGDYVLVHKQNYADNDDIIVAIVNNDDEVTLKKYIKLNNEYVLLQPMSSDTSIQPITIDLRKDKFEIIGKAIGQFGKF